MIGDVNGGKSVGAQLAYSAGSFALSLNGIVGPELPDNDDDVRALVDVVTTMKVTPSLSLGLSADLAREGRPDGNHVSWGGDRALHPLRAARLAHRPGPSGGVLRR